MRRPRTYFQQIAAAVGFEGKLNAKLIKVFRRHGKLYFRYQHTTGKLWDTTLSKLENYSHNKFKSITKPNYWEYKEWKAAGSVSNNFDSYKVYIIKCTKGKESFIKIGKTFNTVANRFSTRVSLPYTYEILKVITGNPKEISELEVKLQKLNKEYKYIPKHKFSGMYECFLKLKKETYANY